MWGRVVTCGPIVWIAGLTGSMPNLTAAGATKFQVFSTINTSFSQPCSINSPKWGGSAAPINVQAMTNLGLYQSCLPDFVAFDLTSDSRIAWSDNITCPSVKWVIPGATAAASVRSYRR